MSTAVTIINPGNAVGTITVTKQAIPPATSPAAPQVIATLKPGQSLVTVTGTGVELVIRQI